jgi:VanZ family protein
LSGSEPWRNPRPVPPLEEMRARVPAKSIIPGWLHAWWPAIVWGVMIFFASTDSLSSAHTGSVLWPLFHWAMPSLTEDQFEVIHHILRKCAHFAEYFIFYLLLFRAIRGARRGWHWSWAFTAWFIAAAYSALDEIHQSFVASRTASPWDSMLDSAGALVALMVVFMVYRFFRRPSTATAT